MRRTTKLKLSYLMLGAFVGICLGFLPAYYENTVLARRAEELTKSLYVKEAKFKEQQDSLRATVESYQLLSKNYGVSVDSILHKAYAEASHEASIDSAMKWVDYYNSHR